MFKQLFKWLMPKSHAGHVYYVRLKTPQGIFYKIGFTTMHSLTARMCYAGYGDEKLIERELLFAYHPKARVLEQTLIEYCDKHRAFGRYSNNPSMPLAGRGQSELFREDVLGLDDALYEFTQEQASACKKQRGAVIASFLLVLIGLVLTPFTYGFSLLVVVGGLIGVMSSKRKTYTPAKRVQHPKHIQKILDSLLQR